MAESLHAHINNVQIGSVFAEIQRLKHALCKTEKRGLSDQSNRRLQHKDRPCSMLNFVKSSLGHPRRGLVHVKIQQHEN